MKSSVALLVVIGFVPLVWLISLEASVVASPSACTSGHSLLLHVISLAAFLLASLGAAYSLIQLRTPERNSVGEYDPLANPRRGLALAALGISALCLLLVVAQSIPNVLLGACQ